MKDTRRLLKRPLLILGILFLASGCNSVSEKSTEKSKAETTNEIAEITVQANTNVSSFTDPRDGNVYKTVEIGNQVWMAENLAYEPSRGNYWAYDNKRSNVATYGYLYDWQTALNVCPSGWRLPSSEDWIELIDYLGEDTGIKLMATGTIEAGTGLWRELAYEATNQTGFTGLPGGYREENGEFGEFNNIGESGSWWSATRGTTPHGLPIWGWGLGNYTKEVFSISMNDEDFGFSVRCIMD
jgi:uncharacterized protein (TIGR02145 family)